MSDELHKAVVRAESLDPAFDLLAAAYAERLRLQLDGEAAFALQVGLDGLQLVELGAHAAGPIRVDFVAGAVAHRRLFGGGNGQTIAKAVGIQPGVRPVVLDATAGLGRDAFVLARLGCAMTLIERHPLIAALLEDGLWRALANPVVGPTAAQIHLICANAIDVLRAWDGVPPQVIYLDPMFPHRDKSDDDDAPALLAAALALASHRVVVKRSRNAPPIAGEPPGYVLEGTSSRFDIYPKKSLKAKGLE